MAADARSGGGTYSLGHTAFEECRYDALGRRVWVRARRWCSDQSGAGNQGDETMCDLSTVRRTVWSGSSELAEIQMPAADLTPSDTVENDTLAVHRQRSAVIADVYYDANRFFGVVLDVPGPGLDQPVAVTRVNYADASDLHTGAVTYAVYAPFSLVGLWNNQGRVDRVVYGGTAAPGATALCVDPGTQYRCVYPGIDWGEFPYTRPGQATHTWQGTVLVDKPDAVGTYYRRNRSYDPNTARFTQEDPLGLAGGLNVYGFASGDPVNFSDPFGLCPVCIIEVVEALGAANAVAASSEASAAGAALATVASHAATAGAGLLAQTGLNLANTLTSDAVSTAEALAPKVHGNSLLTTKLTQGYVLADKTTGEILKFGETTMGKARYTQKYLDEHNAAMVFEASGSKREMRDWEHENILEYKRDHDGKRPPLNKSDH